MRVRLRLLKVFHLELRQLSLCQNHLLLRLLANLPSDSLLDFVALVQKFVLHAFVAVLALFKLNCLIGSSVCSLTKVLAHALKVVLFASAGSYTGLSLRLRLVRGPRLGCLACVALLTRFVFLIGSLIEVEQGQSSVVVSCLFGVVDVLHFHDTSLATVSHVWSHFSE